MVTVDAGQPADAEVVGAAGRIAEPRFQQADHVGVGGGPETLLAGVANGVQVRAQLAPVTVAVAVCRLGHGQVPGEEIEEGGDVGGPLDARVAAQCEDAASGAADVAKQELDDGRAADVLDADGVLGPAHRVHPRGGALAAAVGDDCIAHLCEPLRRYPAYRLHHLGRVARVVAAQDLKHAARILEGFVPMHATLLQPRAAAAELIPVRVPCVGAFAALALAGGDGGLPAPCRRFVRHAEVLPAAHVVRARLGIVSREEAVELLAVDEVLVDERRGVGVADHVLAEVPLGAEDVVDDRAEEDDVAARAQGHEKVRQRRSPRKAGVDVDDRCAARLCLHDPLKTDRMTFGHVRPLDDDAVRVLQVLLEVGGAAPPE